MVLNTIGVRDMKTHYGNLADAVLGEERFAQSAYRCWKSVTQTRLTPATRMLVGLGLAVIGLTALAILGYVPDRFAAATPLMADLEDWLIWGELRSY